MIEEANRQMLAAQHDDARRHLRRDRIDSVVRSIDGLLHELEDLNIQGVDRVPQTLRERIAPVLDQVPRGEEYYERIRVRYRVMPMMDVLFLAQEALFRLKDPRWSAEED